MILAPKEFKEEVKESRVWVDFNTLTKHILPEPYSPRGKNMEC